ncbi:TPA: hypothetical protein DF272_01945 [Candidatus Falkowbacteria bacterium]|nr:hypothetical protein [Candidatus Falkowbacteria bacterium]
MPDNINDKIKGLPPKVRQILLADFGVDVMKQLSEKYYFSILDSAALTKIITMAFLKELPIDTMEAAIAKEVDVDKKQVRPLLIEVLGRRLLVADDYFEGKVTEQLTALKTDPASFTTDVKNYKDAVRKEFAKPKAKLESPASDEEERNIVEERIPELKIGDPESELREMSTLLKEHAVFTVTTDELLFRVDANIIIITLLQTAKEVQPELIKALLANEEKIGTKKIDHQGEQWDPTIGNWLKDYVSFLPFNENEKLSTLHKAKYYAENSSVKNLTDEEKQLLDRIFDTYENIRNFYFDLDTMPISDIQIFPFTEDEQDKFFAQYGHGTPEHTEAGTADQGSELDPMKGNERDNDAVEIYYNQLVETTRKDRKRLSDQLYKDILERKKIEILAGLKLLIEVGLVDNVVMEDKRYRDLLAAHYKRNAMTVELKAFESGDIEPGHVKQFIKYLLTERLGMTESTSGYWAVQFGNMFRAQGKKDLAQMAYFDMPNKEFKWL